MTLKQSEISAIILAGGVGKRMGSKNKGLLDYNGKPLIEHVINNIRDQVSTIVISCNEDLDQYRQFNYPIAVDTHKDDSEGDAKHGDKQNMGPLAGLLSAMKKITTPYCFITACDMPYLPDTIVMDLADALGEQDAISIKTDRGIEPLVSLVRTPCMLGIEHHLKTNRRSVHSWLATLSWLTLNSDLTQQFRNLNHPEDLQ